MSKTDYRANPKHGVGPREGSYAWRCERYIEQRFGVRHAVVVNSGTAALHCALVALGLRWGDEVVTSPITFSATAAAIVLAGGRPVFADVDAKTFCITERTVRRVLSRKTRAILPVHLFGHLADVGALASLGLPVIEDACQAVGCHVGGWYSGTFGMAGCYSFGSAKQCSIGEGGCLVTNIDAVARSARLFANHGENFGGPVGHNFRLPASKCAELLDELARLKDNTPFKRPYIVERRGPQDQAYLNEPITSLPAFMEFNTTPIPVATKLTRETLCVRS